MAPLETLPTLTDIDVIDDLRHWFHRASGDEAPAAAGASDGAEAAVGSGAGSSEAAMEKGEQVDRAERSGFSDGCGSCQQQRHGNQNDAGSVDGAQHGQRWQHLLQTVRGIICALR